MSEQLRTAVIGVGHLGREHARIYATFPASQLVAVCDTNEAAGRAVAERYGVRYVKAFDELFDSVDAVSVATPTVNHRDVAVQFLRRGVGVLVEKPIARTLDEADEMIAVAQTSGAVLQVGHIERFNPAFQSLQQHLTRPLFFEAHRMGIFTPRSLDIDVVMDLMVHELDIISALVPSEVVSVGAVGIPILTPKIDLANARLEFANGCVANVTASRVSGERLRKLRVFQPHEYYSLDYAEQQVAMCKLVPPTAGAGRPDIVADHLPVNKREPLLAEIESFVEAVRERRAPPVSGADGRRALRLAVDVLTRIKEHSAHAGIDLRFD